MGAKEIPGDLFEGYNTRCEVLEDNELFFSERRYTHNPCLYTTKLHKPISSILANPKMYVESRKHLVQSILTFWNLKTCYTLREAIQTDSLPSADQLKLLEQKLAVPVYDYTIMSPDAKSQSPDGPLDPQHLDNPNPTEKVIKTSRAWTPIDDQNPEFLQAKRMSERKENLNIQHRRTISDMSEVVRQKRVSSPLSTFLRQEDIRMRRLLANKRDNQRKSVDSKLEHIYNRVKISPNRRLGLLPPDENAHSTRPRFTAFGHKTALQSNMHSKVDGETLECHEVWRENMLHTAILQPTLPERDKRYKLEHDMKLHFPQIDLFDPTTPVSIILGGDTQADEIQQVKLKDYQNWKEKLIDGPNWKFYRLNSGTEQKFKLAPQFQLDKLQGILKNNPVATYLKKYPVHDIPALPVFDK